MTEAEDNAEIEQLRRRIAQLERVNQSLMHRVERSTDEAGDSFALFQNALTLEQKVRERTRRLEELRRELEESNRDLLVAKEQAEAAARAKSEFLATMSH